MKTQKFPTLYDQSKNGKTKQWKIWVVESTPIATIYVEHGYIDGKKQLASETVTEGKNIGKANETTPWGQAVSQAQSDWQKKIDKGYVESLTNASTKKLELLPMLAHKFQDRAHNVTFPCWVSAKLNGVRALAQKVSETEIVYHSRGGKTYPNLPHITKHLLKMLEVGEIFDGELFNPNYSLQQITSAVKKHNDMTPSIQYWVYDMVQENVPFDDRLDNYSDKIIDYRCHFVDCNIPIIDVEVRLCDNIEDIYDWHKFYVSENFEGTMIRNAQGLYQLKHRSVDLLKLKDFVDDEFRVIGCSTGVGKFAGVAIFQCAANNGKTFDVVCEGPIALKKQQWIDRKAYMNKLLTVRYQALSDEGVPLFPVGVAFRTEEDL